MTSTTPPGNSRRRMARDGTASDSERKGPRGFDDETPEEVMRAIADALDFLEQETAKLGVHGACELIRRAAAMMRGFAQVRRDG